MVLPMPNSTTEPLELSQLLKKLVGDGARWADAEITLAQAEAGLILRGYMAGVAVSLLCFALSITTLVIFAQAGAIALLSYINNPVFAYLTMGLALTTIVVILTLLARHLFIRKQRPVGIIFKWLAGRGIKK